MSSLLRLERKQKISSNAFPIRLFPLCSYSFGIEMINTFIHSRSSLENYTRFHTKMEKSIPVFRPKRPKLLTLCGGTNLHGLYKGVPLPLARASQVGTNEEQSNPTLRTSALYRHLIITGSLFCPWGKIKPHSHRRYIIFMFFFQRNWFPLLFISRSSSLPVIQVNVDIKILWKERLFFFL